MFKLQSVGHNVLKGSCLWEDSEFTWTVSITLSCIFLCLFQRFSIFFCYTWFQIFYLDTTRRAPMLLTLRLLSIFLSSDSIQVLICSLLIQDDTILSKPLQSITAQRKHLFTFLISCYLMFTQLQV